MSEGHGSEKSGQAKRHRGPAEVVELHEGAKLRAFPRPRKALLVLGMHRSGTSAITRVLSLLGADLPRGLMEPVAGDNPAGFWESREIATLHDELLTAAGSSWDDVSPLPEGWFSSDAAADYEDRLLRLLERDFASSSLFVVKDPRIARLVPLWQSVLRRFSAEPLYVLIVRNPLEVAASLKARNDFLPAKSYLLWLWHLLESEKSTRRQPRAVVLFEDLLRDWRSTVGRLERQLPVSWPRRSATATVEIDEFLTERLRHHAAGAEELEARGDAATWVKRAYSAVLDAVGGEVDALAETFDSIHHELARADNAFAPLVAQARLHLARKETELQGLGKTLDSQRLDNERLSAEVGGRDNELAALRAELERLGAAIAQRDGDLAATGEEIQRLGTALSERQTELERLDAEVARRDSELAAGREESQRLGTALGERQTELERLGAEVARRDSELAAGREEAQRLAGELAAGRKEAQHLAGELAERQTAFAALDADLAARSQEVGRLGDQLLTRDSELSRLGVKLSHWERVVELLRRQGREREDRFAAQERELELLRASQEARLRELSFLETEVGTQQTLLSLRGDEIARLRDERDERRAELAGVRKETAELAVNLNLLSQRLVELDRGLQARDAEIASLRGEVDSRGRETERLGLALAESTSSAEALGSRLGRAEGEVTALTGTLREARKSVSALEQNVAQEQSRARGFQRSRSWRVTRPLRWLADGMRGLFGLRRLGGWLADSLQPQARRLQRLRQRFEASGAAALFDEPFYRAQFASPDEIGPDAVLHYLDRGHREGRNPHPLFDTAYYQQGSPEAAAGETVALTHYFETGAAQGRDPHPLFRSSFYLRQLTAPLAAGDNALLHFLRVGAAEGHAPHPLFDPAFYLDANPDVAAEGVNPLLHYARYGGSEGRDPHPRFDAAFYQETNADWADTGMTHLEHYLAVGSERGARTCGAPAGGSCVLIIDHRLPTPDQDSGSLRMMNLISVLQELASRVTFLPHNLFAMEPYTAELRARGVEVLTRPEVDSITEHLEAHGEEYDLVIVCRVTIADECLEDVRTHCRRAKVVFDTVDLQYLRKQRQAELEGDKTLMQEAARVKARELALARSADATWVVSPYEKKLLALEAPELQVGVVSNIHVIHGRKRGFGERRDLLFIGGFEHPPNVDAAVWLVEEILPLVHREEPELRTFLIGSKPTDRVLGLASDRVTVTGYLPDVEPYFARCRLSVAPLRYGAGIKGKVNHSLAYGVPCVLTGVASEGMGLVHGVDAMIAEGPEELAECILTVYRDAELWQRLSAGGLENVRRHFSFPVARQAVADSLGGLDPRWAREWPPAS